MIIAMLKTLAAHFKILPPVFSLSASFLIGIRRVSIRVLEFSSILIFPAILRLYHAKEGKSNALVSFCVWFERRMRRLLTRGKRVEASGDG
jgi:hypothetical protein